MIKLRAITSEGAIIPFENIGKIEFMIDGTIILNDEILIKDIVFVKNESRDKTDVKDIIVKYLLEHGYDGLYDDDKECGCSLEDDYFMPCGGEFISRCQLGYKVPCETGEVDFIIVSEKPNH